MMKTITKTLLYTLSVALLAWVLPWLFHFLTARPATAPFTVYSCVAGCFAYIDTGKETGAEYRDTKGNSYTEEEFDSILPLFYYRQLAAKDRLPDTINGVPVTAASIRRSNFFARLSPRDVNFTAPKLYMLMESMPSHVDLEDPVEAFRMKDGRMTVLRMEDNSVNEEKSAAFNKLLAEKGFVFPMRAINGNPTTKKEYDQGYILIDDRHQVFHIKQMRGRPYVKNVGLATSLKMKRALITEFSDRKTLAFLTDESNRLYVLTSAYGLHRLPVSYDPGQESMLTIGDMFHWTVKIGGNEGYSIYALNADTYELVDTLRHEYPADRMEEVAKAVFPFTLSFTSGGDKWVKPRMEDFSAAALLFNLLLAAAYLVIRRKEIKYSLSYAGLILLMGIFAFIPFLTIKR